MADLDDAMTLNNRWSALGQAVALSSAASSQLRAMVRSQSDDYVNWLSDRRDSFISHVWSQLDQTALFKRGEAFNAALARAQQEGVARDVQPFSTPSTILEVTADTVEHATDLFFGLAGLAVVALLAMKRKK